MKLVFISCYMSPHQKPFCDEMYKMLEGDFVFIATQPIEEERTISYMPTVTKQRSRRRMKPSMMRMLSLSEALLIPTFFPD